MKREEFIRLLHGLSKPHHSRKRVVEGLDHPDVLAIIQRHEAGLAETKAARLKQKTGNQEPASEKVATERCRSKPRLR